MGWIVDLLKDVPLSAVIKVKLVDAEKKIALFEQQRATSKQRQTVLEQQNKNIQSRLDGATKEIERLNLLVQGFDDKTQKRFGAITERVIKHFFDTGRELSVNNFASILSSNISTIQYHFDLLLKDDLITRTSMGVKSAPLGINRPAMYSLTRTGREYVVKNIGI